jgi:hypothetical protein
VAIFLSLRNSPSYGLETHDHLGSVYYKTPRAKDVHRRVAVQGDPHVSFWSRRAASRTSWSPPGGLGSRSWLCRAFTGMGLLVSRRLATPHVRFFVVIWSPFRPSWRFPRLYLAYFQVSSAGHFLPSFSRGRSSTAQTFRQPGVPLLGGVRSAPQNALVLVL